MNLEVLIATVNQAKPFSLVEKMKLNSDAIIANQTDHVSYEEKNIKNNKIKLYNFILLFLIFFSSYDTWSV